MDVVFNRPIAVEAKSTLGYETEPENDNKWADETDQKKYENRRSGYEAGLAQPLAESLQQIGLRQRRLLAQRRRHVSRLPGRYL